MRNAGLDELQAGIETGRRYINNLRYADDTTLMAESKEELKSFLIRVKEESESSSLRLNIEKTKIMASDPVTTWQIEGGKAGVVTDFLFLGSQITVDGDCSHEIRKQLLLGRKVMTNLDSVGKAHCVSADKGMCSQGYGFPSGHVWLCELDHKDGRKTKNQSL